MGDNAHSGSVCEVLGSLVDGTNHKLAEEAGNILDQLPETCRGGLRQVNPDVTISQPEYRNGEKFGRGTVTWKGEEIEYIDYGDKIPVESAQEEEGRPAGAPEREFGRGSGLLQKQTHVPI